MCGTPKGETDGHATEPLKMKKTYFPIRVEQIVPGVWLYKYGNQFFRLARIHIHTTETGPERRLS